MTKFKSLVLIGAIYFVSLILGLFLTVYLPEGNSLSKLFLIDIILTLSIFMFSFRFGNASIYDPYWSISPVFIIGYWWFSTLAIPNYGVWLITSLIVSVWAVQLTYNWIHGWQGMHHQDWRHLLLQNQTGKWYLLVNFLGIHIFPTLLVWVACVPLAYIFTSNEPFTWINWTGALLASAGILIETISDNQLRKFRKSADEKKVLSTGLWSKIRHPNYLGEIIFWWGIYVMAVNPFTPWYISAGAMGITLLFVFMSIPMIDKHLLQNRPSYAGYMLNVGSLLPKLKK